MKTYQEELFDITRYIDNNRHLRLEDHEQDYERYMREIRRAHAVDGKTRMLELGPGTGWFPLVCARHGITCKGLEISRQLIDYAYEFGKPYGLVPDIQLGNAEDTDLGVEQYDIILAQSVFEHIEHWEKAIENVFRALRPGGLFLFSSTSKFSFTSGEYNFPLYGWLPDALRYKLRIWRQGPHIMKLGIDFNQFRYGMLRREFKRVGFSKIMDRVDMSRPDEVSSGRRRFLASAG